MSDDRLLDSFSGIWIVKPNILILTLDVLLFSPGIEEIRQGEGDLESLDKAGRTDEVRAATNGRTSASVSAGSCRLREQRCSRSARRASVRLPRGRVSARVRAARIWPAGCSAALPHVPASSIPGPNAASILSPAAAAAKAQRRLGRWTGRRAGGRCSGRLAAWIHARWRWWRLWWWRRLRRWLRRLSSYPPSGFSPCKCIPNTMDPNTTAVFGLGVNASRQACAIVFVYFTITEYRFRKDAFQVLSLQAVIRNMQFG